MMKVNAAGILLTLLGATALGAAACSDDGNLGGTPSGANASSSGTSGDPAAPGAVPSASRTLEGDVTASRTIDAREPWLLKGLVTVKAGVTLTIEKGATILGDNATKAILLVEPGGKIVADGTADEPIVFTSQAAEGSKRPGDWGGLVLLGNAPVNFPGGKGNVEGILKTVSGTSYGGSDPEDSSGVLRYVRVEYAGIILSQDNEVNGITFGGVGAGTVVDYVQVRMSLDDCFEFFGGTVNAKHLVCQRNQDDGFDFDNGYAGKLQFLVLQQDPTHVGEDNGIESDNDAQGSGNLPLTNPTVYNVTLCGKNADVDNAQFGMLVRKNSRGVFANVVVDGFESSLDIRDATGKALLNPVAGEPQLAILSSLFWAAKGPGVLEDVAYPETGEAAPNKNNDDGLDEIAFVKTLSRNNVVKVDPGIRCFSATAPVLGPAVALTSGAASPPDDGFFDPTAAYLGAVRDTSDTWATAGKWVVWSDR
jgi:hypothetical protein